MLQDALEAATRARSLGTVEMFRAGQVAFAARNTASITASLVKFRRPLHQLPSGLGYSVRSRVVRLGVIYAGDAGTDVWTSTKVCASS